MKMETIQNPSNTVYIYVYGCTFRKNATKTQYLITVSWDIKPGYGSVCIDTKVVFIIAHLHRKKKVCCLGKTAVPNKHRVCYFMSLTH